MDALLSEFVAGIFAVLTALIALWGAKQKAALSAAEGELDSNRKSLSLKVDVQKWALVENAVRELEQNTEIDRVLVLRCWNGWKDPLYTTAVYQWRDDGQEFVQYISVPLDKGYVDRLNDMNEHGSHTINVLALSNVVPLELIVRIYLSELIKHSIWFPVASHEIKLPKYWGFLKWFGITVKAHTYASFATHGDEEISTEAFQKCQNITYLMRDAIEA